MVAVWPGAWVAAKVGPPAAVFGAASYLDARLILPLVVIAVAGFFTIRSNIAKIWRENYEGEVVKREAAEARAGQEHKLRLEADATANAYRLELEVQKAKTDLTALMETVTSQHKQTLRALAEIRDAIHAARQEGGPG